MPRNILLTVLCATLLVGAGAHPALGQTPDPTKCTASSASGFIFMSPDGGHESLADAGLTITVQIRDAGNAAIPGVLPGRITLDSANPALLVECAGGRVADAPTNSSGITTISGVLAGGGYAQGDLRVYIDGVAIPSVIDIEINSTDNNLDLVANLSDLGMFAQDYFGAFQFRSDVWRDQILDIADLAVFMTEYGVTCNP